MKTIIYLLLSFLLLSCSSSSDNTTQETDDRKSPPSTSLQQEFQKLPLTDIWWRFKSAPGIKAHQNWNPGKDDSYYELMQGHEEVVLFLHSGETIYDYDLIPQSDSFLIEHQGIETGSKLYLEDNRLYYEALDTTYEMVPFIWADGFVEGYWKQKSIIDRLKAGELLLEQDWIHVRTFRQEGKARLYEQYEMDGTDYYLGQQQDKFYFYTYPDSTRIVEQHLVFEGDLMKWEQESRYIDYVKIDSGSVTKTYYFSGKYDVTVIGSPNEDFSVAIDGYNTVYGWLQEGQNLIYDAHFGYEKPVFTLANDDGPLDTFYIEDTDVGFDLYEVLNEDELRDIDSPVKIGKKVFSLLKTN